MNNIKIDVGCIDIGMPENHAIVTVTFHEYSTGQPFTCGGQMKVWVNQSDSVAEMKAEARAKAVEFLRRVVEEATNRELQ